MKTFTLESKQPLAVLNGSMLIHEGGEVRLKRDDRGNFIQPEEGKVLIESTLDEGRLKHRCRQLAWGRIEETEHE